MTDKPDRVPAPDDGRARRPGDHASGARAATVARGLVSSGSERGPTAARFAAPHVHARADARADARAEDDDLVDTAAFGVPLSGRAAAAVAAVLHRGRTVSLAGWRTFRSHSVYFQLRVAVVAAWVVVSALTIALAPPPTPDFLVERRDLSFGLANRTAILVVNQDAGDCAACVLEVQGTETDFDNRRLPPGRWRSKPFVLHEGERKTLSTEEFFDEHSHNPAYQLDVTGVRVLQDDDVLWSGAPSVPAKAPR
jgi:hypothetical protein